MFTKVGPQSRNNILLFVYNIFGEREEKDDWKKRRFNARPVKRDDDVDEPKKASSAKVKQQKK